MKLFKFSPLTEKRLERFRRSTVALWSLRLLGVLYVLSLCAELICNDKPLLMRFEGELYFPFLRTQPPEAVLEASGDLNHVDYRDFARSARFERDPGNFAVFAPVPYAPGETLDTKDLERDKVVTISLIPNQPIGRFNLTPDLRIVRQDSCAQFFPNVDLRDRAASLDSLIAMTPELRGEINRTESVEELYMRAMESLRAALERQKAITVEQTKQLERQAPDVEYCNTVLAAKNLHTVNSIATHLGTTAVRLNRLLSLHGWIYRKGGIYYPSASIRDKGYCDFHVVPYVKSNGEIATREHLKWTEEGRRFVINFYHTVMG